MTTKTSNLNPVAVTVITDQINEAQTLEEVTALGLQLQELVKAARARYQTLKLGTLTVTDDVAMPVTPAESVKALSDHIHDGTYTVKFQDGSHVTLKFKTQEPDANFMPGKQLVAYLNGPDNWSNYQTFGTIEGGMVKGFRKYDGKLNRQRAAVTILMRGGKEAQADGLKGYGMESGKCGVCGRKLTTPDSVERGIGPDCAAKLGM